MFDVEKFQGLRRGKYGSHLYYFETTGSTNVVAMDLARERVPEGSVVLADQQTAGRGRDSHSWHSPSGTNLYFTVILYPSGIRLHHLPFVAALSIADVLTGLGVHCDLKWPNDVLVNGRKISGVLIQTSMEENHLQFALIGIGLNVNATSFPPELEPVATSVAQITNTRADRERVLASLLWDLETRYSADLSWEDLAAQVNRKSTFMTGCHVQIEQQGKIITGVTAGVDSLGGLILETVAGREVFYAGEIQSCRKK